MRILIQLGADYADGMRLTLAAHLFEEMIRHAKATYPQEACGRRAGHRLPADRSPSRDVSFPRKGVRPGLIACRLHNLRPIVLRFSSFEGGIMRIRGIMCFLICFSFALITAFGQNAPIVIRAGELIDGKGGVTRNVTIVVEGSKIKSIGPSNQKPTYDFSTVTVMPGMI